jgi:hypothetical protein
MHEEIHPIINLSNPLPDISEHNFFEEININNPYLDMNEKIINIDPITITGEPN